MAHDEWEFASLAGEYAFFLEHSRDWTAESITLNFVPQGCGGPLIWVVDPVPSPGAWLNMPGMSLGWMSRSPSSKCCTNRPGWKLGSFVQMFTTSRSLRAPSIS